MTRLGARLPVALVAATSVAVLLVGCGVEVPDDVAASTSTTSGSSSTSTTAAPTSDDALEQVLIDNGYSLEEARCGAENLRESLSDGQIDEVTGSDTIEDIDPSTASAIAEALQPCVTGG